MYLQLPHPYIFREGEQLWSVQIKAVFFIYLITRVGIEKGGEQTPTKYVPVPFSLLFSVVE